MRVRSSSAPTVRRRPNQRALSMASAAGSANPLSSSTSRSVKWLGLGMLDGHQPDHRAAGGQGGVDAGVHAGARARGRRSTAGSAREIVRCSSMRQHERRAAARWSRTAAAAGCPPAGR